MKEEVKKTSEEWYLKLRETLDIIIVDPDGWDRKNYEYSFGEELITENEFNIRLQKSTVLITGK